MTSYRVVLDDPDTPRERPVQALFGTLRAVDEWTRDTLAPRTVQGTARVAISARAKVRVYVQEEKELKAYTIEDAKALWKEQGNG